MYFTLFMTMVTLLAVVASIANIFKTHSVGNSDAAWAWGVSTMFATALFVRNLGDLLKYMG